MKKTIFAFAVLAAIGCTNQPATNQAQPQTVAAVKTFPRSAFKAAVGKTEKEVLAIFGNPDETSETDDVSCWKYLNKAIDPITGKPNAKAGLFFKAGRCYDTIFR